jgi:ATP-dependent DNA helicase RecG
LLRIETVKYSGKTLRLIAHPLTASAPSLQILFFKGPLKQFQKIFSPQSVWFFSGEVGLFEGMLSMVHPTRWSPSSGKAPLLHEILYPLTKGLRTTTLQSLVGRVLQASPGVPEWLPSALVTSSGWPSFSDALKALHHITHEDHLSPDTPARHRLAFDELLAYQIELLVARSRRSQETTSPLKGTGILEKQLLERTGFSLTPSQENVLKEIYRDLALPIPMARLLQGDVGSGKTILAFLALIRAVESGYQGVFLAPTEVLAQQQSDKLQELLAGTDLRVSLLTRTTPRKKQVCEAIAAGHIHLVVGTHALMEQGVTFDRLGLVVIDEQHRFGVAQRQKLTEKAQAPHILSMSATPIPRTLEMTLFGDLDLSTLTEKPKGRSPIDTRVISETRFEELEAFVLKHVEKGSQVYWVCPLIEEGEELEKKGPLHLSSAIDRFQHFQKLLGDRVALLHGKQKALEKQAILDAFRKGSLRMLVSTTVIEVGVDVPEATLMVVDGAQCFGLAQLHQLRGRVGRGNAQSYCFLLYQYPLSDKGRQRLEILKKSQDGFWIAEQDWRLRGGGDLLGFRQSGLPMFFFADLEQDFSFLPQAQKLAQDIVSSNPHLEGERGHALRVLLNLFRQKDAPGLLKTA